jgi:Amt family ammonium transporter
VQRALRCLAVLSLCSRPIATHTLPHLSRAASRLNILTRADRAGAAEKNFDIGLALNGILGGLVSITANCSVVNHWHAVFIGMIGAFVCFGASRLLLKLKVDDPLDAFAVHGACGFWGLLATGIFCTDANVEYAAYPNAGTCKACSTGEQFGVQFIGAIAIFSWTAIMSGLLFMTIKMTIGIRVSEEVEDVGLDISEHGPSAASNVVFPMADPIKTVEVTNQEP